jgi:hypothetical protein
MQPEGSTVLVGPGCADDAGLTLRPIGATLVDGPSGLSRDPTKDYFLMAKALIGYMHSDLRTPHHLIAENARLRARVQELEQLVLTLKSENDSLVAAHATLLESSMQEMQPA